MPTIFIVIIAIIALLVIVLVIILVKSISKRKGDSDTKPISEPVISSPPPSTPQSKQPIDEVICFLNQDLESKGYEDAFANNDATYRQKKLDELKAQCKQTCKSAITQYEKKIIDIDSQIKIYTRDGYLDSVERLEAQKAKYQKDIDQIKEMKDDLANDTFSIYASYIRGFAKQQRAIGEGLINN
ncbi:MAG: hypothetical protein LBC89_04675 [Bacteroidales bacterium]|jgi:hypothetical protein|nr:hypothetical protein [Bacteroidales bacterium]